MRLFVLSAGMFLVLLDVTVVNVALPHIAADLDAGVPTVQAVVDGYAVPLAALLLACGSLADRYGARRMLLVGMAIFLAGSVCCAAAPGSAWLVAARIVQGVGAAVLLPASQAGVTAAFPEPRRRARALGVWAGAASTALPAGPVLGGLLVQEFGWRAVFWLNVPVVLVLVLLVRRVLAPDAGRTSRSVDVAGAMTSTVALGAVVVAVIEAGHDGPGAPSVIAAAVAVGAIAAFLVVERRASDPMLPPALLRSRRFVSANLVAATMNLVGIGSILVTTLFLQSVQGRSTLASGLLLLPLFLPLVLLSPVSGRLVARVGPRAPMVAGLLLGAVGSASLVLATRDAPFVVLLPALVGLGVGMGLLTAAVVAAAVAAVSADRGGLAAGVTNAARQTGGSLGIALYGAVCGSPAAAGFIRGLHAVGALGAAAWAAAALLTVLTPHPEPTTDNPA